MIKYFSTCNLLGILTLSYWYMTTVYIDKYQIITENNVAVWEMAPPNLREPMSFPAHTGESQKHIRKTALKWEEAFLEL